MAADAGRPHQRQDGRGAALALEDEGEAAVGDGDLAGFDDWEAQRRQMSIYRRSVSIWVQNPGPMVDLLIIANVVEILRKYIARLFFLGSKEWEDAQERKLGAGANLLDAQREYRVVLVAQGREEQAVLESVQRLYQPETWLPVPAGSRTAAKRCLAFRVLSRMLCLAHKENRVPTTL